RMATFLVEPHPDVPARGGGAHHRQAGHRTLWSAVGAGGVADESENPVRREPQRLRAAAFGDLFHRPVGAVAATRRASGSVETGTGDRRRLRAAPQNATPEPETAGRRSLAGAGRHRSHRAARATRRGAVRGPGERAEFL